MTSPSPNGMKIAMARSIAVVRRSPLQRKDRTTRPEKMSRIPLTHIKGKAAGSLIGMPKAVEAPTGLSMKLRPIPMMPTGITRVHQKSSEFLLKLELSKLVVVFICFLFLPLACHGQLERLLARLAEELVSRHWLLLAFQLDGRATTVHGSPPRVGAPDPGRGNSKSLIRTMDSPRYRPTVPPLSAAGRRR